MSPPGVDITKDNVAQIKAAIFGLTRQAVMVGIPSSTAGREDVPVTNAQIGYWMETGVPSRNIPARPFLRPGIALVQDGISSQLRLAASTALAGDKDGIDRALNAAGLIAVSGVRRKIVDGPFAPLAESTLARRAARGVTRTKPLIDTGKLRQSITYVIRNEAS